MRYIVYKIQCLTDISGALLYVGSTRNYRQRKFNHKSHCGNQNCREYNFPVYQMIRANGGWENWEMVPIEELECTKIEASIREQFYIEQFKNIVNERRSYRSEEYKKAYYLNNSREYQRKKKMQYNNIEPNDFNQGESSPENVSDGDQL